MADLVKRVLNCPMGPNDVDATCVHAYLIKLLHTLWKEGENFDSKRPFGNSSWQFDIYAALIRTKLIKGSLDDDGYVDDLDIPRADDLVLAAIESLYRYL